MAKSLTKEENILLTLINAFQNDEKEKLNHLGNISKSLIEVREKVKEEMEKLPPQFNILNLIRRKNSEGRLLTYEPYNSNLLYQLLNIKKKNINFTKLFLEYLQNEKKLKFDFDLNKINYKNIKVDKEYYTTVKIEEEGIEKNGRIDILIHSNINNKETKKSFAIIIENKINADDQDKQLERYYKYISKTKGYGNNVYVIYLTPIIKPPREYSFSEKYIKKVGEKFKNITHGDIGRWLENILKNKEYNFLHKNNFRLLKSALIQIIDNEKSISGENEEGDMTKDEIKELLEKNLFKEIKTVEKADEYIDMFNKANELLEEHKKLIVKNRILPYLDFTRKIYNKLTNKDIYTLLTDTEIIEHILNEGCAHNLEFSRKEVNLQIEIATDDLGGKYYFGILSWEDKLQNKLREKINEIKKIFNKFCIDYNFRECEGAWVYYYHIDIDKDKPEEIANAIDKLYELLKKEIK
ncbi:hypothetical protein EPJ69_08505 [Brachyspira aalborgi]|uniref:PD-(D/E)XK nuclease family protein n=1 Tax=Brachyspira aalborgi TaxID=29522 RepID=A0A5C8DZ45_9SPIR|nr:PD-(D/E)XK nuclease family protein [Brachyspira aalborgi]TXJ30869.1 hypothetical protein EPJ69_08505 [Brachyspira aalborgi]